MSRRAYCGTFSMDVNTLNILMSKSSIQFMDPLPTKSYKFEGVAVYIFTNQLKCYNNAANI